MHPRCQTAEMPMVLLVCLGLHRPIDMVLGDREPDASSQAVDPAP
jgi:hypothetical protein